VTEPLRIGIVGVGSRGCHFVRHIATMPHLAQVVALCDRYRPRATEARDRWAPGAAVCTAIDDLVADDAVEAVMALTVDAAHPEVCLPALAAGKHVFCDKPMALALDDCDAVVRAAAEAPGVFYLGFNLRHSPVYRTAHELVARGDLGTVLTIEACEWYYGGRTYFRRWHRLRSAGGGLWLTKASHDFDLLNWFAGGRPTRVYAEASLSHYRARPEAGQRCSDCSVAETCPDFWDLGAAMAQDDPGVRLLHRPADAPPPDLCFYNSEKDTFDNAQAMVAFDNDVRASLTVNVVASRSTRRLAVLGTKGSLEADTSRAEVLFTERHTGRQSRWDLSAAVRGGHGGADPRLFADFLAVCRSGGTPVTGAEEGRLAVQVGLAARHSADTGQPVEIPRPSDANEHASKTR